MADDTGDREKYKAIYDLCKNAFDEQISRIESMDRKAQTNLVMIGILLGVGIFKLDFLVQTFPAKSVLLAILWGLFLFGAGVCLFSSVYYSTKALQLRDFKSYPNLDDMASKFEKEPVESVYMSLTEYFREHWLTNEDQVNKKANALHTAMTATKCSVILLVLFLTISVGSYLTRPHERKEVTHMGQQSGDDKPTTQQAPASKPQSEKPEVVPLEPTTVVRGLGKPASEQ